MEKIKILITIIIGGIFFHLDSYIIMKIVTKPDGSILLPFDNWWVLPSVMTVIVFSIACYVIIALRDTKY